MATKSAVPPLPGLFATVYLYLSIVLDFLFTPTTQSRCPASGVGGWGVCWRCLLAGEFFLPAVHSVLLWMDPLVSLLVVLGDAPGCDLALVQIKVDLMGRRGGATPPPEEAGRKHNRQKNGTGSLSGNTAENGRSVFSFE